MKKLTVKGLVNVYKRQNAELETRYFRTQTKFDDYVDSFCKQGGYKLEELSDEQLRECAYNFLEYDNK
jgi:hypothetical protein